MGLPAPGGAFLHATGGLIEHDELMLLMPLLPVLLLLIIVSVSIARSRGLLAGLAAELDAGAPLAVIGAVLSLGAAGIHFGVIREHLEKEFAEGVFFLLVAWFQLGWAMAYMLRPTNTGRIVGVLANGGIAALWVASRSVGLPLGEQPWVALPVGMPDLLATSFEVVLVGLLGGALLPRLAARLASNRLPLEKALVLVLFSVATVGLLTGLGLLAAPD